MINRSVSLAPMAGAADSAFRAVCMAEGADFCLSEMVSARALRLGNDGKTKKLMLHTDAETPFGIQLFGYDPEDFLVGAKILSQEFFPRFIDINMGCPAPKITGSGAGAALMQNPERASDIVAAVKSVATVPVTVKIRSGYTTKNAPEFAKTLQHSGADAITLHGRTKQQQYRPPIDLDIMREVKAAITIPLIGNGDIKTASDAANMYLQTGCDAIMVGRAALGNPFIFGEIKAGLEGQAYTPPSFERRMLALRRQIEMSVTQKGEYVALREARKHAAWYVTGRRGSAALRREASGLETLGDLERFIDRAMQL